MGNGHLDVLTQKKVGLLCSGSNAGLSFSSQEIWMSESPMENLEKALCPCLITRGGLTYLWHLESQLEFIASK